MAIPCPPGQQIAPSEGATLDLDYSVVFRIVTNQGRKDERTLRLMVLNR